MLKKSLYILSLMASVSHASCWNTQELSSYAQDEFEGIASMSIKDAVTCEAVAYATFTMLGKDFKADANGIVTLPLPPQDLETEVPVTISKEGYAQQDEKIKVTFGSYWNNLFVMSKALPLTSARFVLSWDIKPADLDLHLVSDDYHISFRTMKNYRQNALLDRDAMKGYGAETITLNEIDKNKTYKVLVHRFSKDAPIDTKTMVRVYAANKLDKLVRLTDSNDDCIEVAEIKNGKINYQTKASSGCM